MKSLITFKNILNVDECLKQEVRVWRNQDFIKENMYNKHEISEQEHNDFLKLLKTNNNKKFFICFLEEVPIGIVSYSFLNKDIDFAYYLKDKDNLSKGYGAVLEYKFLDFFLYNLKADSVNCEVLTKNKKTISLHKKFGFIEEKRYYDLDKTSEEICKLTINLIQWENSKKRIEKLVNRIVSLNKVGEIDE